MLKDWRGTEIKVGSRIVYGVRGSCSIYLREAIVLEVGDEKSGTYLKVDVCKTSFDWVKVPYRTTIININNITVIG